MLFKPDSRSVKTPSDFSSLRSPVCQKRETPLGETWSSSGLMLRQRERSYASGWRRPARSRRTDPRAPAGEGPAEGQSGGRAVRHRGTAEGPERHASHECEAEG